ncbi:MAG TPA: SulP family inorganic anion transporter [Vicinamibacterales bacterium]|nr:SulP family inorganic anion transporter [Vicinamibacterales bacterium]
MDRWTPKSILALRAYSLDQLRHDLVAGVTVGLVALPLAMAFAISSGVSPQAGIYCAIVTGFLISALGGSNFQIGGPTGAFVVVVAGIIAKYGIDGLFMSTMMAGVILVVLGATGFGTAVSFIPQPVVVGFTNGIAVVIASTQIRDLFGLPVSSVTSDFLPRMRALLAAAPSFSPLTAALGVGALLFLVVWRRFGSRIPGYIIVLVASTALTALAGLPVETIGSRFGGIAGTLPTVAMPKFHADLVLTLLSPALTIAMLGAVESLMSAVVADRLGGDRHNPNVELIAQGIANLASPLVGGLPATGALARTATNIRSGARTPIAGMIHAVTLLAVLLVAAPLARYVPLAALAGILLMVAYQMGEWAEIPQLLKLSRADIAVWLVTFALTVLADLTVAVETGMILAMLMFIRKVARTTSVTAAAEDDAEEGRLHVLHDKQVPEYVTVYRVYGPLLFGATDSLRRITDHVQALPPIVILKLRHVTAIDATGLRALEDLADRLHKSGRELIVCGAQSQPSALLDSADFHRHIGTANICANTTTALARAAELQRSRRVA